MSTSHARRLSSFIVNLSVFTALSACDDTTSGRSKDAAASTGDAGTRSDSGADAPSAGKGGANTSADGGSQSAGEGDSDASIPSAGESGSGSGGTGGTAALGAGSSADLSATERASLLFTREEEKMARDVYIKLQGSDPVFENIAASEQMHMDAIATLLSRYALPDPSEGKAEGEFEEAALKALYDRLTDEGSVSSVAAIKVGAEIEELDIRDITEASAHVTHADIKRVYGQLTRGSRNHLRAFYSRLTVLGGSYTAKYLDPAVFEEIAASKIETGP